MSKDFFGVQHLDGDRNFEEDGSEGEGRDLGLAVHSFVHHDTDPVQEAMRLMYESDLSVLLNGRSSALLEEYLQ